MHQPTILCLASYFKGERLMRSAHEAGAHVILVTLEKHRDAAWPREAIDELFMMPDIHAEPDITNAVAYLMRERKIDRIIALDEYDTVTAAGLREFLRIPGLGETTGRHFRDKLAMRVEAQDAGIQVPPFVSVLNDADVRAFTEGTSAPWLLKPRTEASAMGIRRIDSAGEIWPILEEMGDARANYLMEGFVAGDVYHVDAISSESEIAFAAVSKYGKPPLEVYQGGGVFITRSVSSDSEEGAALLALNAELLQAFGMVRGATHAEFIRSSHDGSFHFLEVAARVGGANIDLVVEEATGVHLWEEWARVELADITGEPYSVEPSQDLSAGLMVCLAKEEWPDTSSYNDPEVVWRLNKAQHAGLIVASPSSERVDALLASYADRFSRDFLAVAPPLESEAEMQARE